MAPPPGGSREDALIASATQPRPEPRAPRGEGGRWTLLEEWQQNRATHSTARHPRACPTPRYSSQGFQGDEPIRPGQPRGGAVEHPLNSSRKRPAGSAGVSLFYNKVSIVSAAHSSVQTRCCWSTRQRLAPPWKPRQHRTQHAGRKRSRGKPEGTPGAWPVSKVKRGSEEDSRAAPRPPRRTALPAPCRPRARWRAGSRTGGRWGGRREHLTGTRDSEAKNVLKTTC